MNKKKAVKWCVLFFLICITSGCAPKPSLMGIFPYEMRRLNPETISFKTERVKIWNFQHSPNDVWEACLGVCLKFNGGLGKIIYKQDDSCVLMASRRVPVSVYKEAKPGEKRIQSKTYQTWVTLAIKVERNSTDQFDGGTLVKIVDIHEAGLDINHEELLPKLSNKEPKKKTDMEMRAEAAINVLAQFYYELLQKLQGPDEWKEKFLLNPVS